MEKRVLLATIFSMAAVLLWMYFFAVVPPPVQEGAPEVVSEKSTSVQPAGEEIVNDSSEIPVPINGDETSESDSSIATEEDAITFLKPAPSKIITIDTPIYIATLDTAGARMVDFQLKKHFSYGILIHYKKNELAKAQKNGENTAKLEILISKLEFDAEKASILKEDLAEARKNKNKSRAEEIRAELVRLTGLHFFDPLKPSPDNLAVVLPGGPAPNTQDFKLDSDRTEWNLSEKQDLDLTFTAPLTTNLDLVKKLTFRADSYEVGLEVSVVNKSDNTIRLNNDGVGLQLILPALSGISIETAGSRFNLSVDTNAQFDFASGPKIKKMKLESEDNKAILSGDKLNWVAQSDNYFITCLIPRNPGIKRFTSYEVPSINGKGLFDSVLDIKDFVVPAGGEKNFEFSYYIGPKEYDQLKDYELKIETLVFHSWLAFMKFLKLWFLWFLKFTMSYVHNWGVAIVLLTILLNIITYPLNVKQQRSMRKMQELAPQQKALQEKFKHDKEKLNKEMMKLWKEAGANPMGGCLPMFIQIPIFFAMYSVLRYAVEIRGQGFIWWVNDLTLPDTITTIAGFSINILPILMSVAMWGQQRLMTSKQKNMPQQPGMQMMQYFPFIMMFIFWNMPAGLNLYWFMNNLLGIARHYIMETFHPHHEPKGAISDSSKSS
jgi:YidC/Oxa1 family membrane protein insertase